MKYVIEIDGRSWVEEFEITQEQFDYFMEDPNPIKLHVLAHEKLLGHTESAFSQSIAKDYWYECTSYDVYIKVGVYAR